MKELQILGLPKKELINQACKKVRHECFGQVALVGAGPGDKEYITLKAIKELKKIVCRGDVVLFENDLPDKFS